MASLGKLCGTLYIETIPFVILIICLLSTDSIVDTLQMLRNGSLFQGACDFGQKWLQGVEEDSLPELLS